jgi:hypothetical protein
MYQGTSKKKGKEKKMRGVDVIEGIQNYIINWVKVKKGENILLVADGLADESVVELAATVARAQGASVVVSWIEFNPIQTLGGGKIINAALTAADKMLRFTFATSHDAGTVKACREYGLRIYGVCNPTEEFFASEAARFPVELMLEIARETVQRARAGRKVHITDKKGTDLTAEGVPENWSCEIRPRGFKGDYSTWDYDTELPGNYPMTFPGSIVGLIPPENGSGVAYMDAFSSIGVCEEPMKFTFKDNRIVSVEGGKEADQFNAAYAGIPNINAFVEIMWGLHPKTRNILDQKPFPNEAERRAGNLHLGIGNRPLMSMRPWKEKAAREYHLDGFVLKPTIAIDDKVLIDNGRLLVLDDHRIREIAKKYGDPDKLLAYQA